jgi:precorrin-3B synthase
VTRARDEDACPGALTVHQAADGAMARVRLPGGMLTAAQLQALARAATEFGSATLELTARGNVQLRGITDVDGVAGAVAAAGLLPSASHERVRNIVASPLSGRVGDFPDIRGWVDELDTAIQASAALARLPGRFWFSLDDGRGDVSGLVADVGVHLVDSAAAVLLAGHDSGVRVDPAAAVPTLIGIAERFAESRGTAWRVTELPDPTTLLAGAAAGPVFPAVTWPPVGWIVQDRIGQAGRVALGAAVPLGVLAAGVAEYLAAVDKPLVITPWRSVLVCDLDEEVADVALRVLAPLGLVFDEDSPWLQISCCTGSPGCERSAADVRSDAAAAATAADRPPHHRHWVGCDRACGSPLTGEVLVASPNGNADGYRLLRRHP